MRDPDSDDLERAYRIAMRVEAATAEGAAAVQRRRARVLSAIDGLPGSEATPAEGSPSPPVAVSSLATAANQPRWGLTRAGWRGAAVAACLVVSSALLVTHLREEPQAPLHSETSGMAQRAAGAAPPTPEPAAAAQGAVTAPVAAAPQPTQPVAPAAPAAPARSVRERPARAPGATAGAESMAERGTAQKSAGSAFPGEDGRSAGAVALANTPDQTRAAEPRRDEPSPSARPALEAAAAAPSPRAKAAVADTAFVPGQRNLLRAVAHGDAASVRALLQQVHPDAEHDADGRTALAIAVLRADVPLVKLMLAAGADRSARDRFGKSPLDYAEGSDDQSLREALGRP